ncbi:MAG: hypothetical protein HYV76_02970 [Candidatus Vogelbacteria bacterium]|nr:hypothetical protein [Candidatus Vogelbacteria bacterium]
MSKTYTPEELNNQFKLLPEEIQEVFNSLDTAKTIKSIGLRHNLHLDKIGGLADEVGLILLGLIHPNRLPINLREEYGFTPDEARVVTSEVNAEIFAKIRESLLALTEPKTNVPAPNQPIFRERLSHPISLARTETVRQVNDPYRESIE